MKHINLAGINYRVVKKESKLGQEIIRKYEDFEGVTLWDVYERFSFRKESAFRWCSQRMSDLKGYGLVITSHNTSQFTRAFEFIFCEQKHIAYFTRDNNYIVCLED